MSHPQRRHRLHYDDRNVCIWPQALVRITRQPRFWNALGISIPCGLLGAGLKYWQNHIDEFKFAGVVTESGAYAAITFLLGFLMSFRVNSAFQRFWSGCDLVNSITGDLFNCASSTVAFCNGSTAKEKDILEFQYMVVRLLSLMSAVVFAELEKICDGSEGIEEGIGTEFELIDILGLDENVLDFLAKQRWKVDVVYQWIQIHLVLGMNKGIFSLPPPVVARALQELGSSKARFHEALKIAEFPFPFPYMAALQLLLVTHWAITPLVTSRWTDYAAWAFLFAFIATFSIWFFVGVALEMEKPFGVTENAIDVRHIQKILNHRLLTLLITYKNQKPTLRDPKHNDLSRVLHEMQDSFCGTHRVNVEAFPSLGTANLVGKKEGTKGMVGCGGFSSW